MGRSPVYCAGPWATHEFLPLAYGSPMGLPWVWCGYLMGLPILILGTFIKIT